MGVINKTFDVFRKRDCGGCGEDKNSPPTGQGKMYMRNKAEMPGLMILGLTWKPNPKSALDSKRRLCLDVKPDVSLFLRSRGIALSTASSRAFARYFDKGSVQSLSGEKNLSSGRGTGAHEGGAALSLRPSGEYARSVPDAGICRGSLQRYPGTGI